MQLLVLFSILSMATARFSYFVGDSFVHDEKHQIKSHLQPVHLHHEDEVNAHKDWDNFKKLHQKVYLHPRHEHIHKLEYFNNLHMINKHNEDFKNNLTTFDMGINSFSDITEMEFEKLSGSAQFNSTHHDLYYKDNEDEDVENLAMAPFSVKAAPAKYNACDKGLCGPIRYQGACGCCTVVSALAVLEGQLKKKTKKLYKFSIQNVLDCLGGDQCKGGWMPTTYNYVKKTGGVEQDSDYPYVLKDTGKSLAVLEGQLKKKTKKLYKFSIQNVLDCLGGDQCKGGWMPTTYNYVKKTGGVEQDSDYPYVLKDTGKCKLNQKKKIKFGVKSVINLKSKDPNGLAAKVVSVGPIATGMYASSKKLLNYKSGIYSDTACNGKNINHGVVVVGYGPGYWTIRNSWFVYY
uniref:Pept_C1 domain-containing protein n=1 Tax=Rhabditophanes sp. KR3021 TaxID=114890 RepID=A0AC35U352_9BILA